MDGSVTEEWQSLLQNTLGVKGLYISSSAERGRCLLASRRFMRGEIIVEQDPYVAVLNIETRNKRCDGCYKPEMNFKRCAACKCVWYCGSTCQRDEWKLHQHECRAMVKLMEEKQRILTPSLQLMLRLLFKRKLQAQRVCPFDYMNNYNIVEALPTHMSETKEAQLVLYAQMATLVNIACSPELVDIKEITRNFCRFACNAHTICDEELRPLGVGLYPLLSIINHSCHPNSVMLFEEKHAVVRAIEPIEKGTEVTVSYIDLGTVTATRQTALREQYFFDCTCSSCTGQLRKETEGFECLNENCRGVLTVDPGDESKLICELCGVTCNEIEVKERLKEAELALKEADKLLSCDKISDAIHALKHVEKLQANVLHPHSVHRIRTYDSLLKVCMSLEDWPSALKYCCQSIPIYERAYPLFHPLLGLQLYTRGKLEWYLGNTHEAVKALTRAMEILAVTHGSQTELVKNLGSALQEARAEEAHMPHHQAGNRDHHLPFTP